MSRFIVRKNCSLRLEGNKIIMLYHTPTSILEVVHEVDEIREDHLIKDLIVIQDGKAGELMFLRIHLLLQTGEYFILTSEHDGFSRSAKHQDRTLTEIPVGTFVCVPSMVSWKLALHFLVDPARLDPKPCCSKVLENVERSHQLTVQCVGDHKNPESTNSLWVGENYHHNMSSTNDSREVVIVKIAGKPGFLTTRTISSDTVSYHTLPPYIMVHYVNEPYRRFRVATGLILEKTAITGPQDNPDIHTYYEIFLDNGLEPIRIPNRSRSIPIESIVVTSIFGGVNVFYRVSHRGYYTFSSSDLIIDTNPSDFLGSSVLPHRFMEGCESVFSDHSWLVNCMYDGEIIINTHRSQDVLCYYFVGSMRGVRAIHYLIVDSIAEEGYGYLFVDADDERDITKCSEATVYNLRRFFPSLKTSGQIDHYLSDQAEKASPSETGFYYCQNDRIMCYSIFAEAPVQVGTLAEGEVFHRGIPCYVSTPDGGFYYLDQNYHRIPCNMLPIQPYIVNCEIEFPENSMGVVIHNSIFSNPLEQLCEIASATELHNNVTVRDWVMRHPDTNEIVSRGTGLVRDRCSEALRIFSADCLVPGRMIHYVDPEKMIHYDGSPERSSTYLLGRALRFIWADMKLPIMPLDFYVECMRQAGFEVDDRCLLHFLEMRDPSCASALKEVWCSQEGLESLGFVSRREALEHACELMSKPNPMTVEPNSPWEFNRELVEGFRSNSENMWMCRNLGSVVGIISNITQERLRLTVIGPTEDNPYQHWEEPLIELVDQLPLETRTSLFRNWTGMDYCAPKLHTIDILSHEKMANLELTGDIYFQTCDGTILVRDGFFTTPESLMNVISISLQTFNTI